MTDPARATPFAPPTGQSGPPAPADSLQEPNTAQQPGAGGAESAGSKPTPNLSGRAITLIAVGAVAALLLAGAGVYTAFRTSTAASTLVQRKSPLESANEECGSTHAGDAVLGDGGRTLILHGAGEKSRGLSFSKLECYWSELKMPDSVRQEVLATRALDGRQSGEWDQLRASWSYHPDSGLQMVITVTD
ncbi:hypothetical protein [Micromonospora narathiwatensis]|uniref:Uncharacterized protein n=1 Tax=Micromonospora narathiwatensis TaxID=299146 RepID=A0A1A8ZL21_9ACTN|nr:hypothetical protein [Micromonospora narathiwatensis]SBT44520.1 hypothetical protein GA0070621_2086 [Micromonospora narathiwatensis]